MSEWRIGVIGGSGLYEIDCLEGAEWIDVSSPWGAPSDQLLTGRIAGIDFVFLPRHGRGHSIGPTQVNARANLDALKRAGCTDLIAISAVGSLREDLAPGNFVVVDQFIDRTTDRSKSYFGPGLVAHVSMAEPVCPRLVQYSSAAARAAGCTVSIGGTYLAIEGPQFSSGAESNLYRQWGCDVIGMTAMPEAKLAREAELPYALIGMVTDYDCWRQGEEAVEVAAIIARLRSNAELARGLIMEFARILPQRRPPSPLDTVLDTALITPPSARSPELLDKLDAILARARAAQA